MKIFYAVQATGNGHISRANQIIPLLQNYGDVDVLLSGHNYSLNPGFKVKYLSRGISLVYDQCGSVNLKKTFFSSSVLNAVNDARKLPLDEYDLIINDFDFVTSLACKFQNKQSVHFGHQASFSSNKVPRPLKKDVAGEFVLKNFVKADFNVGLHFKSYDDGIFPPVVKESIAMASPQSLGYYTIYLPSVDQVCIYQALKKLKKIKFHWFTHDTTSKKEDQNIKLFPITNEGFTKSLIDCNGLITGGGFETPAEALFLGKKLLSIPIQQHYEQQCNAVALSELGVSVLNNPDFSRFDIEIENWLNTRSETVFLERANTFNLVDYIAGFKFKYAG